MQIRVTSYLLCKPLEQKVDVNTTSTYTGYVYIGDYLRQYDKTQIHIYIYIKYDKRDIFDLRKSQK